MTQNVPPVGLQVFKNYLLHFCMKMSIPYLNLIPIYDTKSTHLTKLYILQCVLLCKYAELFRKICPSYLSYWCMGLCQQGTKQK
jgi:hypothetical protein